MFAPALCVPVVRTVASRWGARVCGRYGFVDAFTPHRSWVNPDVLGIDQGITLLNAENLRTGRVWRWLMADGEITHALELPACTQYEGVCPQRRSGHDRRGLGCRGHRADAALRGRTAGCAWIDEQAQGVPGRRAGSRLRGTDPVDRGQDTSVSQRWRELTDIAAVPLELEVHKAVERDCVRGPALEVHPQVADVARHDRGESRHSPGIAPCEPPRNCEPPPFRTRNERLRDSGSTGADRGKGAVSHAGILLPAGGIKDEAADAR
jgi:hypothetical protein